MGALRGRIRRPPASVSSSLPLVATGAALIEFGGAVIIAVAVLRALLGLATGASIAQARLIVIAGSLSALGYKSAATLLKAIELGSWNGIGIFAAIFTLRTVIKQLLVWERSRLTVPPDAGSVENERSLAPGTV